MLADLLQPPKAPQDRFGCPNHGTFVSDHGVALPVGDITKLDDGV